MEGHERDVFMDFKGGIHFVVGSTWRNLEGSVRSRESQHTVFRRSLGENQAKLGLVHGGCSVRCVMNFKNDIRAGFDELALAGMENFGGLSRSITDEKIAGQRTGIRLFVSFCRRRYKKDPLFLVLEVVRSGFAEVRDDVVNDCAVGWPNFEHLHPFV